MALLAGAASGYSQGFIGLSDYGGSFTIQIFGSQGSAATTAVSYGAYSGLELMGQSANGSLNNPGTTTYAAGSALGTGYSVELLAGAAGATSYASLTPTAPIITTWYTAAGGDATTGFSGFWKSGANAQIASVAGGSSASVALAAWNNEGGTVNTLAAAQAANDPWGVSSIGQSAALGAAGGGTPPNLPASITSFSLVSTTIPEPSTIALGVMGASAFLMRLRRK